MCEHLQVQGHLSGQVQEISGRALLPAGRGAKEEKGSFNLSSLLQPFSRSIAFPFILVLFIFYEHIFGACKYLKDCDGGSPPWLLLGNSHIPQPPFSSPLPPASPPSSPLLLLLFPLPLHSGSVANPPAASLR